MSTYEPAEQIPSGRTARPRTERDAYPLAEVADRVGGVSIRWIYTLISAGTLKSVKIGGRRLVLRDDLAAFLQNLRSEPA